MLYPHNGILFSAKKKWTTKPGKGIEETLIHVSKQKKKKKKPIDCMIPTIWHSGTGKTIQTENRSVVVNHWSQGRNE
jgi:hypothetical protein